MNPPELPPQLRILIVDDIPSARNITARLLKKLGLNPPQEAGTISQAVEAISQNDFDLIITDVHLKEETAHDLIKTVRSLPGRETMPFVVITSDMERGTFDEIAELGVNSYLLKPFSAPTLMARLCTALGLTESAPNP